MGITNDTVTLDDTLRTELDATAEMYWRWAVREDALAYLCNDLSTALDAVLNRLAPEGTDGQAFSSWVREAFHDNRDGLGGKSLTAIMAMALLPAHRGRWDVTFIVCDYCTQPATRVTDSDEPLCDAHAKEHYADWRTETRVLGERARKRITMSD